MKTAFRTKLIFETNNRGDIAESHPNGEFTIRYMIDTINKGNIEIQAIGDAWTRDIEPVIIIKEK